MFLKLVIRPVFNSSCRVSPVFQLCIFFAISSFSCPVSSFVAPFALLACPDPFPYVFGQMRFSVVRWTFFQTFLRCVCDDGREGYKHNVIAGQILADVFVVFHQPPCSWFYLAAFFNFYCATWR